MKTSEVPLAWASTNLDVIRRLKRYAAREIYPLLVEALTDAHDTVPKAA